MKCPPKTHGGVSKLVKYIVNPEKTTDEEALYTDSYGCSLPTAPDDFKFVREQWGKTGGNFAYHFEQSFKPGEVTPEEAFQCGKELAETLFANDGYQVVIGTHLDRDHLHNHFAVCSVNWCTGKKLQTDHQFIQRMRDENDRICRMHGLSVVGQTNSKGKSYAEWIAQQNGGFTWRGQIRNDIDALIPSVTTFDDLLKKLRLQGYYIKSGKHLALHPPGAGCAFRLYKLGKGYTEEDIAARILNLRIVQPSGKSDAIKPIRVKQIYFRSSFVRVKKCSGFRRKYFCYLHRLRKLLNAPPAYQKKMPFQHRCNSRLLDNFIADWQLLRENKIDTLAQLADFNSDLVNERKQLSANRTDLRELLRNSESPQDMQDLQKQIEEVNTQIKDITAQTKVCGRIYEKSGQVTALNKQINEIQKGMIDNGSRIRSDRHFGKNVNDRS